MIQSAAKSTYSLDVHISQTLSTKHTSTHPFSLVRCAHTLHMAWCDMVQLVAHTLDAHIHTHSKRTHSHTLSKRTHDLHMAGCDMVQLVAHTLDAHIHTRSLNAHMTYTWPGATWCSQWQRACACLLRSSAVLRHPVCVCMCVCA